MAWIALIAEPGMPYGELIAPLIVTGSGTSMAMPAVQSAVVGAVAPSQIGQASGTFATLRQLGAAFGLAVLVAVFAGAGSYASPAAFTDGFAPGDRRLRRPRVRGDAGGPTGAGPGAEPQAGDVRRSATPDTSVAVSSSAPKQANAALEPHSTHSAPNAIEATIRAMLVAVRSSARPLPRTSSGTTPLPSAISTPSVAA